MLLCAAAIVSPAASASLPVAPAAPVAAPSLRVSPKTTRPGAVVVLAGSGWPAGADVSLAVGPRRAGADPAGHVRADLRGAFRKAIRLSPKATPGGYAFVACTAGCRTKRVAAFRIVASIEHGVVVPGQGAAGVTLGMTRAQVVRRLGTPLSQNRNGYLEYGKENLFDVYLDRAGRVDLIGVIGERFCTKERICVGDRMREVLARYGGRVRRHVAPDERSFVLLSRYRGVRTYTAFLVQGGSLTPGAKIVQLFIGTCSGTSYCRP